MLNEIAIAGAGGHARPVAQLLQNLGYRVTGVYDDGFQPGINESILGIPLLGSLTDLKNDRRDRSVVLAVGDNAMRQELFERWRKYVLPENLVHIGAVIEPSAAMGNSNVIMARVYLSAMAVVGDNCIINSGAVIEHESRIGHHCHISVGVLICGRVKIGNGCFVGAGSVIKDNVSVCSGVVIGAGGVVVKDILEPGTYVGNPVKRIK